MASVKSPAEVEIESLGFTYTEEAQYDLTKLDEIKRRVQVRDVGHYAPKDNVGRYAVQMSESVFPPIVVTRDAYLIDGSTRLAARRVRKEKFAPAFVVDVDYVRATTGQKGKLVALAATLNAQNGEALSPAETRRAVRAMIELDFTNDQIARRCGVKAPVITMIRKEIEAEAKLARVGLPVESVRGVSLRALGSKDVIALNDEPYRELATLTADANLNAVEIVEMAKKAHSAGSDAGALAILAELRAESKSRIDEHKLTGKGRPPMPRQLRQHLGFITRFAGHEEDLVETNPDFAEQHLAALTASIAVLTKAKEVQQG